MDGYCIDCTIGRATYLKNNFSPKSVLFRKYRQVKSAIAFAKISQILGSWSEYGGTITEEEWEDTTIQKYNIIRLNNEIVVDETDSVFRFLSFHTKEQRDLFLSNHLDLIKDYYML